MKNAERIVMVVIILLLAGGAAWGYYAVQDRRADYRTRVAAGEFQIPLETPNVSGSASSSDQSNWQAVYPNTIPIIVGRVAVRASVADTMSSRIKGLSGTPYLPDNVVKLFAFGVSGSHSIWMKDMLYPIDIIWAAQDGTIVHMEETVSPDTFPTSFASPVPAWFVVEANAGFVTTNQIVLGDKIVLPVAPAQ